MERKARSASSMEPLQWGAAMSIVAQAKAFAEAKHAGKVRKYTDTPYSEHLAAVVALLDEHRSNMPNMLAAAWLHDTVEDTDTTIVEVADAFGEEVAELVYWLTDTDKGIRSARATVTAWRLGRAPWDAKMIKLADIIDNGRNITEHDPDFARTFLAEKRLVMVRMCSGRDSACKRSRCSKPRCPSCRRR